jgi:hypothetical protein
MREETSYIGNGDGLSLDCFITEILDHVLDEHRALSDNLVDDNLSIVVAAQGDLRLFSRGRHCA